jgi:hypothetical protein
MYGTLSVSYGSTVARPLYGPGQGSMCGPLFWLLCYWLTVESVDPLIPIATYMSACRSILVKVTGVSFVDDTGLGMTSSYLWQSNLFDEENRKQDFRHTLSHLQTIAQHWERLLFTTGGALNLSKCFSYSMSWKQTKGYPALASITQTPGDLTLTTGYEQIPKPIPRIDPTYAFRTLGVHISLSGKQHEQIKVLRIYAQSYHYAVQSSTLTFPEAYLSFLQYLRPKLNYPLPCTTLTPARCKQIQAPPLAALLLKLHMNRHSPHAVVFGSAM